MMNNLRRKLRSKSGATMIMALMFLLFCSFVGGSVLVSATANGYRVAHLNEQQDFLNQRSAALLLSDELQMETGEVFRLQITDDDKLTQEGTVDKGVFLPSGVEIRDRIITFGLMTNDHDVTEMQRLVLETTVWRYLQSVLAENESCTVKLENFGTDTNGIHQFMYAYPGVTVTTLPDQKTNIVKLVNKEEPVLGTMNVTGNWTPRGTTTPISLDGYEARFSSGTEEELYDFIVDFGELSQMQLRMNASRGKQMSTEVTPPPEGSEGVNFQVTTKSTVSTISWKAPKIVKGGAVE